MQKTILLVDDEPNILRALSRLLTDANYQVITANSGKEALEHLKKEKIQVVISDQRMPIMTGSELLSHVKKNYPEVVRIILSGYTDFDAIKEAINEGAIYKFLGKPWDDNLLLKDLTDAFKFYESQETAKKNEKEVIDLMYQDKLTGLTNRLSFTQHLFTAIKRAKNNNLELSLIYIEIDNFNIPDRYGFDISELVLQEIAKRLSQCVKDRYYVSRLGNLEFALVFADFNSLSEVENFVIKVMLSLKQPYLIKDLKILLTVSIGVSLYPKHTEYPDSLRQYAHLALLQSKKLGGNQIQFFDTSMDRPVEAQLALETDMNFALERNQFVVYFQPLTDSKSEKIIGAEALLRWQHPQHGLLTPAAFLSLCEASGLIVDVGAFVLKTVANQIKEWCDMGFTDICIAVNLSQRQFNHPGLVDLIKNILETTKISPHNLELEVTESLIMQNVDHNIELLKSFQKLGLKLALDDFGTGYSSLSYLKQFPFDILKIDGSFIKDLPAAEDSVAIVTAIIAMAKSLGLKVIAEGIEKREQFELLKEKQCDYIQGYLFGKPMPAREFTEKLKLQNDSIH